MGQDSTQPTDRRLDSWKEIAAFFGRDERTVRRWEKESALPVHRVPGGAKGRVFAYANELDVWLSTPQALQSKGLAAEAQNAAEASPAAINPLQARPLPITLVKKGEAEDTGWWQFGSAAMWLGILGVCAALAAGIWIYRKSNRFAAYASGVKVSGARAKDIRPSSDGAAGADSVAVLPFTTDRGDAKSEYLSDGITESLIGSLARLPQLKVRSRDAVFRYKGKDIDVQTAGKNLGVSVLVSGRVTVQRGTVEISAELTDVRNNTELWGRRYTGKRADLISLQEQLAGDIAGRLRSNLSAADRQQVANQGTQNAEAYSLYLKGRYAWNNRTMSELNKAIAYFNEAIAKDPDYALAYSGLADVYSVMPNFDTNPNEEFPKSNAAARKALELDPSLAHPHAILGENEMQFEWDFAGGEAEFKKSFELDPNDATAHQWYADDVGMLGGREQEALAEIKLAEQIDPQSLVIQRVAGGIYVWNRQYDEAIAICGKLARENPTFAIAYDCLGYAYWGKRMYPDLIREWKTYARLSGYHKNEEFASALEQGYLSAGWKGALRKAIEFREEERKTMPYSALKIARYYADLGEKEQAFHWLDIAYQEHDWLLMGLNTYFQLDSLRSDPRYAELQRKVGLAK